jgi:hypothetical protein
LEKSSGILCCHNGNCLWFHAWLPSIFPDWPFNFASPKALRVPGFGLAMKQMCQRKTWPAALSMFKFQECPLGPVDINKAAIVRNIFILNPQYNGHGFDPSVSWAGRKPCWTFGVLTIWLIWFYQMRRSDPRKFCLFNSKLCKAKGRIGQGRKKGQAAFWKAAP